MTALYNEHADYPARWLRNLASAGHVASGVVDSRSIHNLKGSDVARATQFHAFAGIGGWSLALRLAGWPDDAPVWTGSCPCQPWSNAGRRDGVNDARHLWPEWFRLIRECRPPIVFGEQVASTGGRRWLDAVSTDLERDGYAVGAACLPAASVGAPHIRERIYFVARRMGDTDGEGLPTREREAVERTGRRRQRGAVEQPGRSLDRPWAADWIACADGKSRAVEPGTFPLAHGVPCRVGRLRAYGNAIVPQRTATFIRAVMECP